MINIDRERDLDQRAAVDAYMETVNNRASSGEHPGATIVRPTGYGKSRLVELLQEKTRHKNHKYLILVPLKSLKDQWNAKGLPNTTAETIQHVLYHFNSGRFNDYDIIILDEAHRFASEEFSNAFALPHKAVMCLTATLERLDGKEALIEMHAPVCSRMEYAEAARRGWIERVTEFNLMVSMSPAEQNLYNTLNKRHKYFFGRLGWDFQAGMACLERGPVAQRKAFEAGTTEQEVIKWANQWNIAMQQRKKMIYTSESKHIITMQLLDQFRHLNRKTIVFGQSVPFISRIANMIGPRALEYHSYLESRDVEVTKREYRKTEKGAKALQAKKGGTIAKHRTRGYRISYKVKQRMGSKRLRELALQKLADNRTNIDVILSAKALEVGLDIQDVEVALITSRNQNPTNYQQIRGRIGRKITDQRLLEQRGGRDKQATLVNLVLQGTKDEKWTYDAQKATGRDHVRTVYSVEELMDELDTSMSMENLIS